MEDSGIPTHIAGMSNHTEQPLQMLHVTADGIATAMTVPAQGAENLRGLVGGLIEGITVCGELSFYGCRTAPLDREPNPFVFDIVSQFGEPNRMVFGDVVFFAGTDSRGNERSLSDALVAVLIELVQGATGRPESMAEIIELSNDLRELALAV